MSSSTRLCFVESGHDDSSAARWLRTMSAMSKRPAFSRPGIGLPLSSLRQEIERARRLAYELLRHARIAHGRLEACVSQEMRDDAHVGAMLEQVRREAVTQHVRCDALLDHRGGRGLFGCRPD